MRKCLHLLRFCITKPGANNPPWEKIQVRVWEVVGYGAKEREGKWIPCTFCWHSCSSSCSLPSFMFTGDNSYMSINREEQSQLSSIFPKWGGEIQEESLQGCLGGWVCIKPGPGAGTTKRRQQVHYGSGLFSL